MSENIGITLLWIGIVMLTLIGIVNIYIKLIYKTLFVILTDLYYAVYNMFLLQKGVNQWKSGMTVG